MTAQIFILILMAAILLGSLSGSMWKVPTFALGIFLTVTFELAGVLTLVL